MLFKTSIDRKQKEIQINHITGESYSFLEKIKHGLYGSSKYKILDLCPEDIGIHQGKSNNLLYGNFELKKEGMALYFRFLNDEYTLVGRYNQITFQTNDRYFEIQMGKYAVKMEITNKKAHWSFLKNFGRHRTFDSFPHMNL